MTVTGFNCCAAVFGLLTAFVLVAEETPQISGRIVFHVDSDNSRLHAPAGDFDGQILIYSLPDDKAPFSVTRGLPLGNAMNAHFSPDGRRITFMALPKGEKLEWEQMHAYILDIADRALIDLGSGQDPKFAPDGATVVFKNKDQLWRIHVDGSGLTQLIATPGEKSGPQFSPDGTQIVYWLDGGSKADIWRAAATGAGAAKLIGDDQIQEYYPMYRTMDEVLYTRWESQTDHHDKIYSFKISTQRSERLSFNAAGAEDSDAFVVNADWIGFSSSRPGGKGGWDIYLGNPATGAVVALPALNGPFHELGGAYSPFQHAGKNATPLK